MYTDEDLNYAVSHGIFSKESVNEFRRKLEESKKTQFVDEENFRLISSFNDIFVVIACSLLLFSSLWALQTIDEALGSLVFSILAWMLAEYFILKRKMALPAIVLLLSFVGGIFSLCLSLYSEASEISFITSAAAAATAAYLHWRRFGVPITVAAGTAAIIGLIISTILSIHPHTKDYLLPILFICGVTTFIYAMYWDSADKLRTTKKSDVAFWLHLLAAPLIIHPVFSAIGIFDGDEKTSSMIIVISLYLLMTLISITVDRRAFMISSLIYVIYAISNIFKELGTLSYSFALTGIFIGSALLVLSVYWHTVRSRLIAKMPPSIKKLVPAINL